MILLNRFLYNKKRINQIIDNHFNKTLKMTKKDRDNY